MAAAQDLILVLDQGTTSLCALLFGRDGALVSGCQKVFEQYYPKPERLTSDEKGVRIMFFW